jgi:hypothetical protein
MMKRVSGDFIKGKFGGGEWSRTTDAAASMFGDSRAFSLFQAFLQHPPCSPGSQLDFHEQ